MNKTFAFLMCAALPIGCGDNIDPAGPDAPPMIDAPMIDAPTCTVVPGAWTAPNFTANATAALALRAQIKLLVGDSHMAGAEKGLAGVVIDEVSDLEAIYNGGTPALSANAHTTFDAVIDDAFAEFVPLIAAGARDMVSSTGWDPGTAGGIYGARKAGFNTGAIEVRQIADKGLFGGGALYHYALKQTEGTIDEAKIDAITAAWGSNETLDQATKTHSANYSHAMGFHARIATSLTAAKAYAADSKCATQRDAALVTVFRQWEQSLIARGLFYGNDGVAKLAAAGANDDLIATALHGYAEGIGLVIGFHGLPHPTTGPLAGAGRKITDADIEAVLTAYGVNRTNLAASTIGAFVIDTTAFQTGVTAAEARVKQVYQLSDAELAAYRTPAAG